MGYALTLVLGLLAVGAGEIAVAVREVSVGGVAVIMVVPAYAQFGPQPVKIGSAAVVLELAGHLHLLGLGSAAPHWLDPLEHAEPGCGSCSLHGKVAGFLHSTLGRRGLHRLGYDVHSSLHTLTTVPALRRERFPGAAAAPGRISRTAWRPSH